MIIVNLFGSAGKKQKSNTGQAGLFALTDNLMVAGINFIIWFL